MSKWVRKASRTVYKTPYVSVYEDKVELPDPSRRTIFYTRVDINPFSAVLPIIINEDTAEKEVLFVKTYRYPIDKFTTEIPAGHINPNETPEQAAHRELFEETGYKCKTMEPLLWYNPYIARSDIKAHIFLARDLEKVGVRTNHTEIIDVFTVSLETAYTLAKASYFEHAPTVIALLYLGRRGN